MKIRLYKRRFLLLKNNTLILDQLNKLNDLYKNGVLTKEEFDKAKKKIFN